MTQVDPKIEAAFVRGYMNKLASSGLEKEAFIQFLAPLIGGFGVDVLASRLIAGPLLGAMGRALARREAAGLGGSFISKGLRMLRGTARARIPGTSMRAHNIATSAIAFPTGMAVGDAAIKPFVGNNDQYSQYPDYPEQNI